MDINDMGELGDVLPPIVTVKPNLVSGKYVSARLFNGKLCLGGLGLRKQAGTFNVGVHKLNFFGKSMIDVCCISICVSLHVSPCVVSLYVSLSCLFLRAFIRLIALYFLMHASHALFQRYIAFFFSMHASHALYLNMHNIFLCNL